MKLIKRHQFLIDYGKQRQDEIRNATLYVLTIYQNDSSFYLVRFN